MQDNTFITTSNTITSTRKTITFYTVILFGEVLIGLSIVFIIFFVLNFYHIIDLSRTFPFLPTIVNRNTQQSTIQYISPEITYFRKKEDSSHIILMHFLSSTLKTQYIPSSANYHSQFSSDSYMLSWENDRTGDQFIAQLQYEKSSSLIKELAIQIDTNSNVATSSAPQPARTILSKYFLSPNLSNITCRSIQNHPVCDILIQASTGKTGYAVFKKPLGTQSFSLFSCQVPKTSSLFSFLSSCFL